MLYKLFHMRKHVPIYIIQRITFSYCSTCYFLYGSRSNLLAPPLHGAVVLTTAGAGNTDSSESRQDVGAAAPGGRIRKRPRPRPLRPRWPSYLGDLTFGLLGSQSRPCREPYFEIFVFLLRKRRDYKGGRYLALLVHLAKEKGIHRKKRVTSFPSPAGMSLTKLPLGRNITREPFFYGVQKVAS